MADINNQQEQQRENGDHMAFTNGHGNYFDQIKHTAATSDCDKMKDCFVHFDKDCDGYLNMEEFSDMLHHLFCNARGSYDLDVKDIHKMFKLMDENQDELIDEEEFQVMWYHWFKQILDPVSAFILVDVQNDFITGSLSISNCPAQHDGGEVVPVINKLLDQCSFDVVVYTYDWHPHDHISFVENVHDRPLHSTSKVSADEAQTSDVVVFQGPPVMEQILWPAHCVQGSWGSELHPDLKVLENSLVIRKGINPDVDSYSAFWDNMKLSKTTLEQELTERGVTDVYVCGIAYDVCVGATAKHALEHGFRTVLVEDACRGVSDENITTTKKTLIDHGAIIVDSSEVPDLMEVKDRRPELAMQAALNVALARRLVNADKKAAAKN